MFMAKLEFKNLLDLYNITEDYLISYPFGEYYKTTINYTKTLKIHFLIALSLPGAAQAGL